MKFIIEYIRSLHRWTKELTDCINNHTLGFHDLLDFLQKFGFRDVIKLGRPTIDELGNDQSVD